uniref:Uncharacterized protein n=1 Tax=Anguilla anguilla TaxID=7936 RepID=A0A0E9UZM9_ANGAN
MLVSMVGMLMAQLKVTGTGKINTALPSSYLNS